ncbi:myelin-oligodendrocyte glycoprotein-like [Cheilinus undulatus]|uniref:myelin-oligodendrocyte glycoprotein-like n=1 Tax=Cheilinus undulatus TaxID=241271 RepID=UPI001BD4F9F2|nr:myelin-oligodendrocyte glycoprotein-like [Cheilinus undulatus]
MKYFGGFGMALRLWTFAAPFSVLVWTVVDGQHVIGFPHIITVQPGDDVVLPCHVEPKFNVKAKTIEWSRPMDRMIQGEYVHLYRNRKDIPDGKIQSYIDRTSLFPDLLMDGNISLKIRNITMEDQGTYRCFIPKLKGAPREGFVMLVVDPNFGMTTETPLDPETPDPIDDVDVKAGGRHHHFIWVSLMVLCLALTLGVGVSYVCKQKYREEKADLKETDFVALNANPSPA